jgi:hypothetical protein
MSPVQQTSGHATRALLLSGVTVGVVILVLWGASVVLTHRHNSGTHSGTVGGKITLAKASKLADEVAKHGPIFYPDVSGNHLRDLYLQHVGAEPTKGWMAFLVQVPGAHQGCVWQWQAKRGQVVASCDPERTLAAAAPGLQHFPTTVTKGGKVEIDLTTTPAR